MLSIQACVLAILAVMFTKGAIEPATVMTLILASPTLGLVAIATGWQGAALAGSVAWSAAWGVTGLVVARRLGWGADEVRATCASVGVLPAAFSLLALAGRLRREPSILKSRTAWASDAILRSPVSLAWPIEIAAFASSLIAVVAVMAAGTNPAALGAGGPRWESA